MKLTITPGPEALRELEALENIPTNLLEIATDIEKRRRVQEAILAGFAENFADERAGEAYAWAALKPSTNLQRRLQGYDPEHPILVRTTSYKRSWIDTDDPEHDSTLELTNSGFVIGEGSRDYRAPYHEQGTPNMAAREVSRLSLARQDQIGQILRQMVIDAIERRD